MFVGGLGAEPWGELIRSSLQVTLLYMQIHLRGHIFGRLYSDGGVPLSRRQHRHLVQKLIDAGHQVIPVFGLVRNIVENLRREREEPRNVSICMFTTIILIKASSSRINHGGCC